jgi:hypothetical protein
MHSALSCLPLLQVLPGVTNVMKELKNSGNIQNHTVHSECIVKTVETIRKKVNNVVDRSNLTLRSKTKATGAFELAITTVEKRHPPASPLGNTSPTKKQKLLENDDGWQDLPRRGRAK